jgi:2-polyprenyl-6-methoxyphenol hydroxylase-like FAD-dependent oxidoreductase
MPEPSRILIVGGGIAGLALARALREQGIVAEIIERTASWPVGGIGLYLPGNGVRALGTLGLADTVLARAVRMSHQRILDHAGRHLAKIELAQLWKRVGPCVGVARHDLHRILLDGTAGVPLRLGATVTTLSQQDGEVNVVFSDGSTGTYALVVARITGTAFELCQSHFAISRCAREGRRSISGTIDRCSRSHKLGDGPPRGPLSPPASMAIVI